MPPAPRHLDVIPVRVGPYTVLCHSRSGDLYSITYEAIGPIDPDTITGLMNGVGTLRSPAGSFLVSVNIEDPDRPLLEFR